MLVRELIEILQKRDQEAIAWIKTKNNNRGEAIYEIKEIVNWAEFTKGAAGRCCIVIKGE